VVYNFFVSFTMHFIPGCAADARAAELEDQFVVYGKLSSKFTL
jgi:hypothetical protein